MGCHAGLGFEPALSYNVGLTCEVDLVSTAVNDVGQSK